MTRGGPGSFVGPRVGRLGSVGSAVLALVAGACSHTSPYWAVPAPGAPPVPPPSAVVQRIILIGDAGAPSVDGEPVLEALRDTANSLPGRTVVVFLGDNVYPAGLPGERDGGRSEAERRLAAQLEAMGDARAVFVPGNHDWNDGKVGGMAAVERQAAWVEARAGADFSPLAGCPGPEVHDLRGVRLVALDTQWWLQPERRPDCAHPDTARATAGLVEALAPPDGRPVVVVGHHPLASHGPHGGFFTLGEWIFPSLMANGKLRWVLLPLPGVGPLVRRLVRSDQDFGARGNREMRKRLEGALRQHPPLAFASGHEHSLQVLDGGESATLFLVSGLGSSEKATSVGSDEDTHFAHQHPGFMILDILPDRALLRVVEPGEGSVVFWHEVPLPGSG